MSDDQHDFDQVGSGASATYPMQAGALRKNGYVMLKGRPCKIVDISTSKTGKHGHAKANITGLDIFTGKKYEDVCPTSHNMDVPTVTRCDYELVDIDEDGFASLMDDKGEMRDDLKIPEGDVGSKIREEFGKEGTTVLVTVQKACGEECIIATKNANN